MNEQVSLSRCTYKDVGCVNLLVWSSPDCAHSFLCCKQVHGLKSLADFSGKKK